MMSLENPGILVGLEPADTDEQIAKAFRESGLDFSLLSDQAITEYFKTRPDFVRIELTAGLDSWAIKCRKNPQNAALSDRLLQLARTIDPDPLRDELRRIAKEWKVGDPNSAAWFKLMVPLTNIGPRSTLNRLLEIASKDPGLLPPLTVHLLAEMLQMVNQTELAPNTCAASTEYLSDRSWPSLHGREPATFEQAVASRAGDYSFTSLTRPAPEVGSLLALAILKANHGSEAVELCKAAVSHSTGRH